MVKKEIKCLNVLENYPTNIAFSYLDLEVPAKVHYYMSDSYLTIAFGLIY